LYSGKDESELSDLDREFGVNITPVYKHWPIGNEDGLEGSTVYIVNFI
jgi:hypothetical protein